MRRILSLLLVLMLAISPVLTRAETEATAAPVLKTGSSGEAVAALQNRLISMGFLTGTADGNFGAQTQKAVMAVQTCLAVRGYEVAADGIVGLQTATLLYDAQCMESIQDLRLGDKGEPVSKLQKRLIEIGFLFTSADGDFGQKTEDALKNCQQALIDAGAKGISANGILDSATRAVLYSGLSKYELATPVFYTSENPESLQAGHLYAEACVLMDAETGEVLFAKNADARMYPASTTKIMTLLLALQNTDLDETVTLPAQTDAVPGDSSRVPVHAGETMTMRDLVYGLMIRSGNDAANAIATLVSGSTDAFAALMNETADKLGMTGTHYVNAHGYHNKNHYTTARDMGILTCAALKNSDFKTIVSAKQYTMAATELRDKLVIQNKYSILDSTSKYYYRYAFGVKTGYTSTAGQCYVGAATCNNHTLVAVVLKSGTAKANKWEDAAKLFDYGFAVLESGKLA